jgi:hypothetical protein
VHVTRDGLARFNAYLENLAAVLQEARQAARRDGSAHVAQAAARA